MTSCAPPARLQWEGSVASASVTQPTTISESDTMQRLGRVSMCPFGAARSSTLCRDLAPCFQGYPAFNDISSCWRFAWSGNNSMIMYVCFGHTALTWFCPTLSSQFVCTTVWVGQEGSVLVTMSSWSLHVKGYMSGKLGARSFLVHFAVTWCDWRKDLSCGVMTPFGSTTRSQSSGFSSASPLHLLRQMWRGFFQELPSVSAC